MKKGDMSNAEREGSQTEPPNCPATAPWWELKLSTIQTIVRLMMLFCCVFLALLSFGAGERLGPFIAFWALLMIASAEGNADKHEHLFNAMSANARAALDLARRFCEERDQARAEAKAGQRWGTKPDGSDATNAQTNK